MTGLRLIADDLTGALDAAAQFARPGRPIPVFFGELPPTLPPAFGVDSATREAAPGRAAEVAAFLAPRFAPGSGGIAFKKLDSLLRGPAGAELAATVRVLPGCRCLIAPAFPFQGRVTRGGRQHLRRDGVWLAVGEDVRATLADAGIAVQLRRAGEPVPEGVSLWDAETDDDLRRLVAAAKPVSGPTLWCGTGGLAAALAGALAPPIDQVARPILGLFGTDHPVTVEQLLACGPHARKLPEGSVAAVAEQLAATGVSLVSFALPADLSRPAAAAVIAQRVAELTGRLAPPGCLLVAGGETLRTIATALGAARLDVIGQIVPGVPVSRFHGGRWDGVTVISKSGAFGGPDFLLQVLALDRSLTQALKAP